MTLCGIEKHFGVGNSEHLRYYIISFDNGVYIEESMTMLSILSQNNLIIEKFYLDKESDIKKHYNKLRKHILDWLGECDTKPEINDQQYSVVST